MLTRCHFCGKASDKPAGEINRALGAGLNLYCDRKCADLARRKHKTKAQRVEEKRRYDKEYRRRNRQHLKVKKHAYHVRTYDPAVARVARKKRAKWHAEYCRRPEYREWKSAYDKKHRAQKWYGPFAEAAMLTFDLNREIKSRSTNHEIKWENRTANKTQLRRREAKEKERSRPRYRNRRRNHPAALSQ